jgi:hypothetical protein
LETPGRQEYRHFFAVDERRKQGRRCGGEMECREKGKAL